MNSPLAQFTAFRPSRYWLASGSMNRAIRTLLFAADADFRRCVTDDCFFTGSAHEPQGLTHTLFRDDVEERRLHEIGRKRQVQRVVENRWRYVAGQHVP